MTALILRFGFVGWGCSGRPEHLLAVGRRAVFPARSDVPGPLLLAMSVT